MKNWSWSKFNKRIISYLLIAIGIYMGLLKYEIMYVIVFLGSGLLNIGMAIFYKIKNGKNE